MLLISQGEPQIQIHRIVLGFTKRRCGKERRLSLLHQMILSELQISYYVQVIMTLVALKLALVPSWASLLGLSHL